MNRYTNYDELLREITTDIAQNPSDRCHQLLKAILDAPVADVVEVVRCEECKHCVKSKDWACREYFACTYNGLDTSVLADHYCSYGERREWNEQL